ncbi:MAG: NACHT domain-containing protein [Nostoc sp.]
MASSEGIKRAKVALRRQSLTQKALADEFAIASWATVSKFFNAKPVDRSKFIEICERLDLDWQDIAAPFLTAQAEEEELTGEISAELAALQRYSQRARTALDPYILPRIRREALLQKCLTAIRRGLMENKRRVIPILGAAGYGKSTILGSIYDELVQAATVWVGLVRCNDLIETVETFATEVGEKISGVRESVVEIASRLSVQHGRGILLIDTLDLILEKKLVPVLRGILLQLLDNGTTIVFTCRESDYRDFFEPDHESFAGFTDSIERCLISEFNDEEVKEAATAFYQQELGVETSALSTDFAEKIIALSADSKSLADITRNPLLLALMCKLFGEDGNVPEDLTVSQLYQMYWDLRIASSRKAHADNRRIGMMKKNLCLTIAEVMYNSSDERLRDFVYESQLQLNETEFLAYEELMSDGVLQELGADRVSFFHQTFLEYVIARYFESTPKGEQEKHHLLNQLTQPENTYFKHYIWPVIRQLLNLVNFKEFHHIVDTLDKAKLSPFRTVAFASVSRTEPESSQILLQLLQNALQQGDAYQDVLLVVASGAPNRHLETVWTLLLEMINKAGITSACKAADIAGELLKRIKNSTANPVEQAILAVSNRQATSRRERDQNSVNIFGKLITAYARTPKTWGHGIDAQVLNYLQECYFWFGSYTRSVVIQLYLTPGVPIELQQQFLLYITRQRITDQGSEKEKIIELLEYALPSLIQLGNSPFGSSYVDALNASLPSGWDLLQAAVVGYYAVRDTELINVLINDFFQENIPDKDKEKLRRHLIALSEAIKGGAGNSIALILLQIPIANLTANQLSLMTALISRIANPAQNGQQISAELALNLANWIIPIVNIYPVDVITILDYLVSLENSLKPLLEQLLEQSIPQLQQQQLNLVIKRLQNIPISLESYLLGTTHNKESRLALVKFYQQQAEDLQSKLAVISLLNFCQDDSREVALDAGTAILRLVEKNHLFQAADFISVIANAKILGVRQNCLKALIQVVESGSVTTESDILAVCHALHNETVPELVQPLYNLVINWIEQNNSITDNLAEFVWSFTNQLISTKSGKTINNGIANSAFVALKIIANLEYSHLSLQLGLCTRNLLRAANTIKLDNSFIVGLLYKITKFDDDFLACIVREDCVTENYILPSANISLVAVAILYAQGKYSPLLDEMLNNDKFPPEVKSLIIREREG